MKKIIKLKVPHIQQSSETTCGAAALLMIYKYLGLSKETEKTIWKRLKIPRKSEPGKYFMKTLPMAKDSEKFKFDYLYGQAKLSTKDLALQPIKEFLNLSIPVVVSQRISSKDHLGHFRVVTGIDDKNLFINDPQKTEPTKMEIKKFIYLWSKADNDEVIGGEFFAIFDKNKLKKINKFRLTNFYSSADYFDIENLKF